MPGVSMSRGRAQMVSSCQSWAKIASCSPTAMVSRQKTGKKPVLTAQLSVASFEAGFWGIQVPELGKSGFQLVNRNNRAAEVWPLWALVARTAARRKQAVSMRGLCHDCLARHGLEMCYSC